MKKIALITRNKILAQSLAVAIDGIPDPGFEFLLFLNSNQALLDAEVFEIDIALIDVLNNDIEERETWMSFCERLNKSLPNCHVLLLMSQDDKVNQRMAREAKKKEIIDDFVFYDSSLKYLLTKLTVVG